MPTNYESIAEEIAGLVTEKEKAYGSSFSKSGAVLALLFPNGVPPDKLHVCLFIARIVDKLFRMATDPNAFGESPAQDIVGYGLLEVARSRRAQPGPAPRYDALYYQNAFRDPDAPPLSPEDEAKQGSLRWRPSGGYVGCCKASGPGAFICTRNPNHAGDHIAWGSKVEERWPGPNSFSFPPPLPRYEPPVLGSADVTPLDEIPWSHEAVQDETEEERCDLVNCFTCNPPY